MATFTVSNTADAGAGSLRQAILDANAAGGADVIEFTAGADGVLTLASGDLVITGSLTINGRGADKLTIDGNAGQRIFTIDDAALGSIAVSISGLTLTKGNGNAVQNGGAIYVENEIVTLDRLAITASTTSGSGGALFIAAGSTVTVSNSTFSGNTANIGGGAVRNGGTLTLSNSTIFGNTATTQDGGGLQNAGGTMAVNSATIVANSSGLSGGGISNAAAVTVANSIVADNTAPAAGAIDVVAGGVTATYSLIKGTTLGAVTTGAGVISGGAANAYVVPPTTTVGGLTVYAPAAGTLVVDAGDPAYAAPPAVDELGRARVSGGRIDMGAVELQAVAPVGGGATTPTPPPASAEPALRSEFGYLLRYLTAGSNPPLPASVVTPGGQVLANPLIERQKLVKELAAKVDAGQMSLQAAHDQFVDLADDTTSVATLSYQFFTGHIPTREGLDYLVSSPLNPTDLIDGYYAGMSLENRYINFAVNLGKVGEGRAGFQAGYGSLSLGDAMAKAYAEIFGKTADAAKLAAILTPERSAYFLSLGGDALGQKAAMVGFLLGEAAKADTGPYAVMNENFLYDLIDGVAGYGTDLHIYLGAGPKTVGLVGVAADVWAGRSAGPRDLP